GGFHGGLYCGSVRDGAAFLERRAGFELETCTRWWMDGGTGLSGESQSVVFADHRDDGSFVAQLGDLDDCFLFGIRPSIAAITQNRIAGFAKGSGCAPRAAQVGMVRHHARSRNAHAV